MRRSLLAVCVVAIAVLSGCDSSEAPPRKAERGVAILAFQQDDHMRFADAAGNVWGDVPLGIAVDISVLSAAVWSADGRHLAWLDESRLHIVEARSGRDRPQPCPCRGLDRLGDRFVTIDGDGNALLLFNPSGDARRVPLPRRMPSATLVGGGRTEAAIAEPVPEEIADYRGQSTLMAVNAQGTVRMMIDGTSRVSIWSGSTAPEGDRIATIESPSGGACATVPGIFVLNHGTTNPATERLVPSDVAFTEAVLGEARLITATTWTQDGLVVTFGPNDNCQAVHPGRYVTYLLANDEWTYLRDGALAAGFGPAGRGYAIELDDTVHSLRAEETVRGRLVLTQQGEDHELGDRVSAIWPTPAEQTAGHVEPITRPKRGLATTTDTGRPVERAVLDLVREIDTAARAGDTTALTALCGDCDQTTRDLITTPEGRQRLRASLRTHPAADDRTMTYPGLTTNGCFDVPAIDNACTMEQLRDVGNLGLKSTLDIEDPGTKYAAPSIGSVRIVLDDTGTARWHGQSNSAKNYRHTSEYRDEPWYVFLSPDGTYNCGFDSKSAACQGETSPIPPRPASCGEGPGWGYGMYVDATTVDFVCAGDVLFYPEGRPPDDRDKLAPGQSIAAVGFTCLAEDEGITCAHDESGRGFYIAPTENRRF